MRKENKYLQIWFSIPPSNIKRLFRFAVVDKPRPKFLYHKVDRVGSGIRTRFYIYIMVRL